MTLNDITVKQLMDIQGINPNTLEGQRQLIQCIYGIDPANLPFDEFLLKTAEIPEIFQAGDRSFKKDIVVNGEELTAREVEQLSTREFIDFDTLAKEGNNVLPTLLAIIYTNDIYNKKEYTEAVREKSDLLLSLDAGTALGAINFFSKALLEFVKCTVLSSEKAKEIVEKNPAMKKAMEKIEAFADGAGN